jgi:hypothetical protein
MPLHQKPSTVLAVDAKARQGLPEPWYRPEPSQAAGLEKEAAVEIGPGHELSGHRLAAIAACGGGDNVAFHVDDDTFAIVHLTWTKHAEPAPWPSRPALGGYMALETVVDSHQH